MLTAFTVIALWLGWNVWLVQQRQSVADSLRSSRRGYWTEYAANGAGQFRGPGGGTLFTWSAGDPSVTVRSLQFMMGNANVYAPSARGPSWFRQVLGDRRYASVVVFREMDVEQIRRRFPEAIVLRLPAEYDQEDAPEKLKIQARTKPEQSVLVKNSK
jgi:hypothetical protein